MHSTVRMSHGSAAFTTRSSSVEPAGGGSYHWLSRLMQWKKAFWLFGPAFLLLLLVISSIDNSTLLIFKNRFGIPDTIAASGVTLAQSPSAYGEVLLPISDTLSPITANPPASDPSSSTIAGNVTDEPAPSTAQHLAPSTSQVEGSTGVVSGSNPAARPPEQTADNETSNRQQSAESQVRVDDSLPPSARDTITGSRLGSLEEVSAFLSRLHCLSTRGRWRLNPIPRLLPWTDSFNFGVFCQRVLFTAPAANADVADAVVTSSGSADDWPVADTAKYEWVVDPECGEWEEVDVDKLVRLLDGGDVLVVGDSINMQLYGGLRNDLQLSSRKKERQRRQLEEQGQKQQAHQHLEQQQEQEMVAAYAPSTSEQEALVQTSGELDVHHTNGPAPPPMEVAEAGALVAPATAAPLNSAAATMVDRHGISNTTTCQPLDLEVPLCMEIMNRVHPGHVSYNCQRFTCGQSTFFAVRSDFLNFDGPAGESYAINVPLAAVLFGIRDNASLDAVASTSPKYNEFTWQSNKVSASQVVVPAPTADANGMLFPPLVAPERVRVVIVNRGAHFIGDDGFVSHLNYSMHWLRAALPDALIIYRNTPHGHVNCSGGKKPLETLPPTSSWPYNWANFARQNELAKPIISSVDGVFVDVATMTTLRVDGHAGTLGGGTEDCLHYCLPGAPNTWAQLLYNALLDLL